MNEKLNAGSSNGASARGCDRAEQLVTYLYGEAAPTEAKAFRQHLTGCAVCRDEVAALGGVRELVSAWRKDALDAIPSLGLDESFASISKVQAEPTRQRSALAALREFFSLSPLWLQAGAAASVLLFCALSALTLARVEVRWDASGLAFNTGVKERVVEREKLVQVPVTSGFTQEEVNAQIAAAQTKWEADRAKHGVGSQVAASRQGLSPRSFNPKSATRKSGSQSNRQDLASSDSNNDDFFNPNEERVPRLTDLLGAVNSPKED